MPCRDEWAESRTEQENIAKVHNLTEMLCDTCKAIGPARIGLLPQKVQNWWKEHQEADARQAQRDKQAREQRKARLLQEQKRLNDELARLREYE